jgi:ABC-type transporter Mla MlaB component
MFPKSLAEAPSTVPHRSPAHHAALANRPLSRQTRRPDQGCDCDVLVDGAELTLRLTGCLDMRPLDALTDIVTAHAHGFGNRYVTLDLSGVCELRDSGLALLMNLADRAAGMGLQMDITGLRQDILERLQLIEGKTAANW